MPYITDSERRRIGDMPSKALPGELNYKITVALDFWLEANGVNYSNINTAIGVLECAKLELYRRVAAGYEDKKCALNGDVYTCLEGK